MSKTADKCERFNYLIWVREDRDLTDAEEMELRELEEVFCVPFGGGMGSEGLGE